MFRSDLPRAWSRSSSDYKFCSTGVADASQTVIIRRADLVTGAFTSNSYAFLEPGPLGLQPAQALTSSSVEYEVANDYACGPPAGPQVGKIAVIALNGLPTAGSMSWTCTTESETSPTSVPPAAAQAGTSATLATGTDRFLSVVWANGTIWVAGNTGCVPSGDGSMRSCLNLVSIAASATGSVTGATQLAAEGVSGAYLYDPAIGLDSSGDVILTFDESSGSALETMMTAAITGGTWSSFSSLQPSADFYDPAGCSTPCAWGDVLGGRPGSDASDRRMGGVRVQQRQHGHGLRHGEHVLEHVRRAVHLCRTDHFGSLADVGTRFRRSAGDCLRFRLRTRERVHVRRRADDAHEWLADT